MACAPTPPPARARVKTHQILTGTWSLARPHYHKFFWGKNTEEAAAASPELQAIKIASRFGVLETGAAPTAAGSGKVSSSTGFGIRPPF